MANLQVKDASNNTVEIKATGTGSSGDPFITENTVAGVGTPSDSEATTNTGSFTLIQFFKRLLNTTLLKGSQTTANSLTVALPSDVATVPAGGTYNSTSPTLSNGQRSELQLSSRGGLLIDTIDIVSTPNNINTVDSASSSTSGANGQSVITGNPTNNSSSSASVSGNSSFAVLITGTFVGTLQFERSLDNGTTYTSVGAFSAGTSYITQTTTAPGAFHGNASSATHIRVRATAWTSGVASVRILAGQGTGTITVGNPIRLFDRSSGVEHTIKAASTLPATSDTATAVTLRDHVITTYTHSTVSPTTSSGTVIAANTNRRHLLIINTSTTVAYIRLASSGATTSDIPLAAAVATGTAGGSYEISMANGNLYTGAIVGITASGTATLSLAEGV